MKPPYDITPKILKLVTIISEKIGEINANFLDKPTPELRKQNKMEIPVILPPPSGFSAKYPTFETYYFNLLHQLTPDYPDVTLELLIKFIKFKY